MSRPGDRTKNYQPTQLDQGIAAVLVAISRRDRGRMAGPASRIQHRAAGAKQSIAPRLTGLALVLATPLRWLPARKSVTPALSSRCDRRYSRQNDPCFRCHADPSRIDTKVLGIPSSNCFAPVPLA